MLVIVLAAEMCNSSQAQLPDSLHHRLPHATPRRMGSADSSACSTAYLRAPPVHTPISQQPGLQACSAAHRLCTTTASQSVMPCSGGTPTQCTHTHTHSDLTDLLMCGCHLSSRSSLTACPMACRPAGGPAAAWKLPKPCPEPLPAGCLGGGSAANRGSAACAHASQVASAASGWLAQADQCQIPLAWGNFVNGQGLSMGDAPIWRSVRLKAQR